MDILSPDLIWSDGSCYRINDVNGIKKDEEYISYDDKPSQNSEMDHQDDECFVENLEFVTETNGRVKVHLDIAYAYFGYIIGTKGSVLRRIMNETKTDVKMPPRGKKGSIIIAGPEKKNVTAAVRRIVMIVWAARKKQKPTHFLSIPLNSDEIILNFNDFKKNILINPPQGVDESIFTKPTKIHLTILVLCLMDSNERVLVSNLLDEANDKIIKPLLCGKTLDVEISNVSYMNDDPTVTNVLYGEVKEVNENQMGDVQKITDKLIEFFSSKGFESRNQTGKLHVTLMKSSNRVPETKKSIPFDASTILKTYSDYYFGKMNISEIHLSQMHTMAQNGYYQPSHVISL